MLISASNFIKLLIEHWHWANCWAKWGLLFFTDVSYQLILDIVHVLSHLTVFILIYDMSSKLIKKIIDCIDHPLTYYCNKCLTEGMYPDVLKI